MAKKIPTITDLSTGEFQWTHLSSTGSRELAYIKRKFRIQDRDLHDVPPPTQRPKIVVRENYVFMILLFPIFNRRTREVQISEVDFMIGKNFLVTANEKSRVPVIREMVTRCKKHPSERGLCLSKGIPPLVTTLLEQLLSAHFPMLIHMSEDVDGIERKLFDIQRKSTIYEVLRVKTNITNFRRAIMGHKSVIERLNAESSELAQLNATAMRYLIDMTKEYWNLLENHRETLGALHDTNNALLSYRTNEIMRTLTVFSVIVFPLTLLAAIFGMNTTEMPLVGNPYGFWIIVFLMGVSVAGMIVYFRRKHWI